MCGFTALIGCDTAGMWAIISNSACFVSLCYWSRERRVTFNVFAQMPSHLHWQRRSTISHGLSASVQYIIVCVWTWVSSSHMPQSKHLQKSLHAVSRFIEPNLPELPMEKRAASDFDKGQLSRSLFVFFSCSFTLFLSHTHIRLLMLMSGSIMSPWSAFTGGKRDFSEQADVLFY